MSGRLTVAISTTLNYSHSFSPVRQDSSRKPATRKRVTLFLSTCIYFKKSCYFKSVGYFRLRPEKHPTAQMLKLMDSQSKLRLVFDEEIPMSIHSTSRQAELNLGTMQFALVRRQTTYQVRLLIKQLTGKSLSAQELLRKGKSGSLQLSSSYGLLIITPDSTVKTSRLWRWNVEFIPTSLYRAS